MKTIFSRTFSVYLLILLAALLLVGVSFQFLARDYLTDNAVERLKNDCAVIAHVAEAYHEDNELPDRSFLINLAVAAETSGADAVICDASGTIRYCSDAPLGCQHQGMTITSPQYLQEILTKDFVISNGVIDGLYTQSRYVVSTAIRDQRTGAPLGIIILSTPMASTNAILKRLSDTYVIVSLLVVLVAVIIMTIYTRKHSNPLRHMAQTAIAFGHGDLTARATVPEASPDEIRELALAFNNMAGSLEKGEYQRREFVTNVSHELKTPMTTIGGYVDGILDGTIPASQQAHYLQLVSDETKRLNRLVRSMLDISQLQEQQTIPEDKKTQFEVQECIGRALISFERQINAKRLDVQVNMPEHPVYTHACQDYITQVIYNLLDNAVKFCPEGGQLELLLREGAGKLYVSISNSGQTIPPEELPLVFDRFHKTDKSRSQNRDGWGLGLYIVRTLVCSHGEDISVSSAEGKTTFTFTLPLAN